MANRAHGQYISSVILEAHANIAIAAKGNGPLQCPMLPSEEVTTVLPALDWYRHPHCTHKTTGYLQAKC
jgi:hypothetical protein